LGDFKVEDQPLLSRRLSVVVPAFNEAERLPPTLQRIGAFLAAHPSWQPAEIVVVDDGSTDATAAVARAISDRIEVEIRVISLPVNRGKGAAVRNGFAAARGSLVLLTDADLSAPIEEVETLVSAAGPREIAVGSRAVDRRLVAIRQPRHRDFMGRIFNLALRFLRLTRLHDTQCGFKLFPGNLARDLAATQRLDGFAFDVELLVLAEHWGYRVREVGVRWQHVEASRVLALRHSGEMLRDALRVWWWRATSALPAQPENGR
jgi:dolichyl-phosphate beta-glucosyltransferase